MSSSLVLSNRRIFLGITGGIALYKCCDLIRSLRRAKAELKIVLSKGAEKFISPLLFSALSNCQTLTDADFFAPSGSILHIELGTWAEVNVIVPATASFLSKLRTGQASELLLATLLASKAPTYIFPAMNSTMLEHPAVRENLEVLRGFGYLIYEPKEGELACGIYGKGRLPEPDEIFELLIAHFKPKTLLGRRVLITGGPTREYLDDVRFLTNASSGKTAYYLLREAYYRGAEVHLLWGLESFPFTLPRLDYVSKVPYPKIYTTLTTEEMFDKALELFPDVDLAIFASAPCDFTPVERAPGKLKKGESFTLSLRLTPDIAKTLGQVKRSNQICVGFALEEPDKLLQYALQKKREKNFDIIIANPLGTAGKEMSSYLIIGEDFRKELENISKEELANLLFDLLEIPA